MMTQLSALGMYLVAVAAGMSFIVQQAVNTSLRVELNSPWWACFVSYLGGTIVSFAMVLVMREPWLTGTMISRSNWMSWTGGLFGAIYIGLAILLVPRLGTATVVALLVLGQMLGAIIFDHYAILGVPEHPVSALRLLGAALLVGGVVLIRF